MVRRLSALLVSVALCVSAVPVAGRAADLTIAGSTTVASTVLQPFKDRIEKLSGVGVEINPVGSGPGILALSRGQAQVAAIAAPLADVVRKINSANPGSVDGRELVAHEIGSTKAAVIVHPSNPVKSLTFKQITDILAGRITVWREVGGPNMPIEIMMETKGGGIRTLMEETIGAWGDVLAKHNAVQTGAQVVVAVAAVPNAIGVASVAQVDNRIYMLQTDRTIEQRLYLVTRGQPNRSAQKVIQTVRALLGTDDKGAKPNLERLN